MCLFCMRDEGGDDAMQRVHVLRLLALIEHPDALPKDSALRLAHEVMALMKPKSGVLRCQRVTTPGEPTEQYGDGATVLLRADMDGLPIEARTGLDYASDKTGQARFGAGHMQEIAAPFSASEDFNLFGAAWGVPAVFWVVGGIDPDTYATARKAGKLDERPVNHSPAFAPVIHPNLRVGIEAMLAAASVWLAGNGA